MKAVVLGGAGVIGSHVVEYLSKTNVFSHIVIGDITKPQRKISASSAKLTYHPVDATKGKDLAVVLKNADVVINCVGPFYKYAPTILTAALEEGIDYVDVCDDYDTTRTLLDTFHAKAVKAGVTCIVGLGASPGLTNIIAAYAAHLLSKVIDIQVYVTRGIHEEAGGAIPYHMLHCWLGNIPIYHKGRYSTARGLIDGEEYVTFPEPFGQRPVYYFGHPETVTLPRYIKGLQHVCCKGTFIPPEFRESLLHLQELGLLETIPLHLRDSTLTPLDFTAAYIPTLINRVSKQIKNVPRGGAVMVRVSGMDDAQPKTYWFSGTSRMREGTATPAAVGALMIAQGDIHSPGVQAPEGCVPPEEFINFLLKPGLIGDTWITVTQKIMGPL